MNNEALEFFLDNERVHESHIMPDEAIDYIFMLEDEELDKLADEWNTRDEQWRSAISYLIGFLELPPIHRLILKGLNDDSADVVEETLVSVYRSLTESESADTDFPPDIEIPEDIKQAALAALEKVERHDPEITELKKLLDEA